MEETWAYVYVKKLQKKMRKPNTHDYIVIEKEKKIILTHIIFEFILEAS